eukprot:evm.model.NODE_4663_length_47357_cov_23.541208.5
MTVGGDERLGTPGIAADVVLPRMGLKVDGGEDDAEGEYDEDNQGGEDPHLVGADEATGSLEDTVGIKQEGKQSEG